MHSESAPVLSDDTDLRATFRGPSSFPAGDGPPMDPEARDGGEARRVLASAAALLEQGERLVLALPREAYGRKIAVAFDASIGAHLRHCLDHFASLLAGADTDWVDYDHRARDAKLETDPEFAARQIRALRGIVEDWDPEALEGPVRVRCAVSYDKDRSPTTRSTLGREFVYAIAHGIHHFALIAIMARLQGVELPSDFGVAPSTVAYRDRAGGGRTEVA
ncbi:MAG: hypothetical protein JNL97_17180 [Verrucomicrobiales bacterium]|nr:hypothetical protein [Verrucomicrobiales bacterium]